MPKTRVVNGVFHTFPDDATEAEIDRAVQSLVQPVPPAAPRSEQRDRVDSQEDDRPQFNPRFDLSRFGQELYFNSPLAPIVDTVRGGLNVMAHPYETYFGFKPVAGTLRDLAMGHWNEKNRAVQKARDAGAGDYLAIPEALGHGVAAIVPVVGPAASRVGQMIGEGDFGGGLGATVGLLSPFAAKYRKDAKKLGSYTAPVQEAWSGKLSAARAARARTLADEAKTTVAEQVLAPGNPAYKKTAFDIAERVAREAGPRNRVELRQFAEDLADEASVRIDTAIARDAGQPINVRPTLRSLRDDINRLKFNGKVIAGNERLVDALETKYKELRSAAGRTNTIPIEQLVEFRRQLDEISKRHGQYQGRDVRIDAQTMAVKQTADRIRADLANARPDLADANADYTYATRLSDVLDPTKGRPKILGAVPYGQTGGIRAAGTLAASASDVPLVKTFAPALGELYARYQQFVNSDAYKLTDARTKLAMADALKYNDVGLLSKLLQKARVSGVMATGATIPRPVDERDEMASQSQPLASLQAIPRGLNTLPEGQKVVFHEGPFAGQVWGKVKGQPVRVQ
jgi:hypothetical protein